MRRFVPLFILAAAAVTVTLIWVGRLHKDGNSDDAIRVSGHIEATEVDVGFKIPGRVLRITVDEGDAVQAGELIAVLDDRELVEEVHGARAALEEVKSRIPQLESQINQQAASTRASEAQARASLEASQAELRDLQAGSRPQEIRQAEAEVGAAKADLERYEEDFQRADALIKRQIVSRQSWEHSRAAYEMARDRYQVAKERLALVREGPRKEKIQAARAKVDLARANLELASTGWLLVERLKKELVTVKAQVTRAEAAVRLAETRMAETRLIAPISGVVLVRDAEEGEVLPAGTPVVTIGDLENVWLEAYIQEEDLGRVRLGDQVRVTTDTFPERVYEGSLSYISDEAEFTPKNVQTQKERVKLVYRIKVDVPNSRQELKPGMPADGVIVLSVKAGPLPKS